MLCATEEYNSKIHLVSNIVVVWHIWILARTSGLATLRLAVSNANYFTCMSVHIEIDSSTSRLVVANSSVSSGNLSNQANENGKSWLEKTPYASDSCQRFVIFRKFIQ